MTFESLDLTRKHLKKFIFRNVKTTITLIDQIKTVMLSRSLRCSTT